MSRSYRKHPRCKDSATIGMKRIANKKVRHTKNVPNGGNYKKCFCSYDISDWNYYYSWKDYVKNWEHWYSLFGEYPKGAETKEKLYRRWRKYYCSK